MRFYVTAVSAIILAGCSQSGSSGDALAADSGGKVANGPFGIALGEPMPEDIGLEPIEGMPHHYRTVTPPKTHPDFETVVVEAFDGVGVCMVKGVGRTLVGDGAGSAIRSKVDNLAAALETKYGTAKKSDVCAGGDIQCDNDFWMMTLGDGERSYAYNWETPTQQMEASGIGIVFVGAQAENINDSYPALEFYSIKKNECEKAAKASSASSL